MTVLAVFLPVLMLGVVLALGRYEDFLLPDDHEHEPGLDTEAEASGGSGPLTRPADRKREEATTGRLVDA